MSSSKWFAPTPIVLPPDRADIWDEPAPGEYLLKTPRDTETSARIEGRLDTLTRAVMLLSDAVAKGARPNTGRPFPEPVLMGWRCPGCGAVHAPAVTGCERCNKEA